MKTEGSRLLASAGTSATIARALGVAERSVTAWKSGRKTPSGGHQDELSRRFRIRREAWLEPPHEASSAARHATTAEPDPELGDPAGPEALKELADAADAALDAPAPAADGTSAPRLPWAGVGYAGDVVAAAELTRALLRDLQGPAGQKLDMVTRSKLLGQAAQTLQRLGARSTDNLSNVSKEALESSPSWVAWLVKLGEALKPYPEALRAVSDALARG